MRANKYNSMNAEMTATGMYGFIHYSTSIPKEIEAPEGLVLAAIQAFDETLIAEITPDSDSIAQIPDNGMTLPEGQNILFHAKKIKINSGTGVIYLGGA